MKWNEKGLVLCIGAFVLLVAILFGKAFWGSDGSTGQQKYAEEEDVLVPVPSVSGSAIASLNLEKEKGSSTSNAQKKSSKSSPKPALVHKEQHKKEKKERKQETKTNKKLKHSSPQKEKKSPQQSEVKNATTTSIPSSSPTPVTEEKSQEVFLVIQCCNIMNKKELWRDGLEEILPSDGIFYQGQLEYEQEDTVYDLIKKVCKEKNIALDAQYTPLYGTYYIKGIGNLYEFDCGSESGWKYSVNGVVPNVGCSSYSVKTGDKIEFFYDYQY